MLKRLRTLPACRAMSSPGITPSGVTATASETSDWNAVPGCRCGLTSVLLGRVDIDQVLDRADRGR